MILDGRELSAKIRQKVKSEVAQLENTPQLVVVLVGDNPASEIYVKHKEKACKSVGIACEVVRLEPEISENELLGTIESYNKQPGVHAILIQLPLPAHINAQKVINTISPEKDVDGLTAVNQGKLLTGEPGIIPATPKGIDRFFAEYHIDIQGKRALVIGRSQLVGLPTALLLLRRHATVTVAHSRSQNLDKLIGESDVVVSAVGQPNLITAQQVKPETVLIDVGINRYESKIVGDAKFSELVDLCSYITPVPGGVGPMTIASLLENVVECYKRQR